MKIVYWDIENIKYLHAKFFEQSFTADIIRVCHAKPFENITNRVHIEHKDMTINQIYGRGPDLADIQILSYLNHDAMRLERKLEAFLITEDKLLSYQFIVLSKNLGLKYTQVHTLLRDKDIRNRRKKGRALFDKSDLSKLTTLKK